MNKYGMDKKTNEKYIYINYNRNNIITPFSLNEKDHLTEIENAQIFIY